MTEERDFAKLLSATMDLYDKKPSKDAISLWWATLRQYDLAAVRNALSAHIQDPATGKFAPKPADVIGRIQASDGHPGPEEAWSMLAHALDDEGATVVWTDQMRTAFFVATGLSDDRVAARMAFKEHYTKSLASAREQGLAVRWTASLGHDKGGREPVLTDAVRQGRLTKMQAQALLPALHMISADMATAVLQAREPGEDG